MKFKIFSNNIIQNISNILPFHSCIPSSPQLQTIKCNYHCPVCRTRHLLPNIAGRFNIITSTQCQCNGCNTIFDKSMFYFQPESSLNLDERWIYTTNDLDIKSETETLPESVI